MVKNPLASAGDMRHGFDPCIRKIPWRRNWQPTTVLLPGKFHGQRNLAGYSPWDHKKSATIERLSMQTQTYVDTNIDLDKTDVHIYMYISKEKEERLLTTDFSESRSRKPF